MSDCFKISFPNVIDKTYKQNWDDDYLNFFKFLSQSSYIVDNCSRENKILNDEICHQCKKSKWAFEDDKEFFPRYIAWDKIECTKCKKNKDVNHVFLNCIQKINYENCAHLWKLKHITRTHRPKYHCLFCHLIIYAKNIPLNTKNNVESNSFLSRIFSAYKSDFPNLK